MGIIQFSVFLRNTHQNQNPQIIIMNPMFAATLAVVALSVADATIIIGTTAAAGTAVTISAASATSLALLGGVAVLKGLVLGAALAGRRHGKRSAEESSEDAAFAILTNSEPAQCYRRLVCDMATWCHPRRRQNLVPLQQGCLPCLSQI